MERRVALLGAAAGLLGGCETIGDLLGDRKDPLPGERRAVLDTEREVSADPALSGRAVDLPAPREITAWPQVGGNPVHSPGHASLPVGSLREAWRASVGADSGYRRRITSGPVASTDTVYAADAFGQVSAFELSRGARRWRVDTRPGEDEVGGVGAGCALDSGLLFVATGLAEVLALDPATGAVRWRVRTPAPTRGAPTAAGGRLFVVTLENHLLALSAEDGRVLWTHRALPVTAVPLGLPAPAVDGEAVLAGFPSGELVSLRATDGRLLWTETLSAPIGARRGGIADIVGVRGLPVVAEGRVIATGQGGTTLAVDLRSGRRLWERDVGSSETPAVVGEWIFLVSTTQELVALGRDTGQVRWVTSLNVPAPADARKREPARFGAPLVVGGRIVVPGSGGEALLVDPVGGVIDGRLPLAGSTTLPAAIAGGALLLLAENGILAALRG